MAKLGRWIGLFGSFEVAEVGERTDFGLAE